MKAALVFTYSRPSVGREAMAMEAFADAFVFFGKLAADEKCDAPLSYLDRSGHGMMIVHGDREFLNELALTDEFLALVFKAGYAVPDMAYEVWWAGDGAYELLMKWAAAGADLGVM